MKSANLALAFSSMALVFALPGVVVGVAAADSTAPDADAIGWRIGCQLWSFNKFSFMEAIDKTASIGLKYAEAFPGQRLSLVLPETVKFDHTMSEEHRLLAQQKLEEAGVKLLCYGVVGLSRNETEARKVFEFAKVMGIETVVSEPAKKNLPAIDELAKEYNINVAIHNHPKPSYYWDYKVALDALEDCSPRLGVCADTGHWSRSGLDPLDAVKALKGRLISFHLKDLNAAGEADAHDVIWGTGALDLKALLKEVKDQGVETPVFSIEYEYNWDNNVPDIAACVEYFNQVVSEFEK
ncbi:MAG: sugar phosphate isomerase/epimerase [Candidatus Hydrogenedentes bacterium]|nr:sugar phosphate isomerase/epimerase [Candidatus Hydrogenedentota bacterium]